MLQKNLLHNQESWRLPTGFWMAPGVFQRLRLRVEPSSNNRHVQFDTVIARTTPTGTIMVRIFKTDLKSIFQTIKLDVGFHSLSRLVKTAGFDQMNIMRSV